MKRFSAGGFLAALFAWLALAAAWTPFPAQAQVLAGHSIVASLSRATDPCPGAAVCAKFTGAQGYKAGGQITRNFASLPGLTVTRSTGGYAEAVDGSLVWFPPASPRITGKGLLVEQASTNILTQSQLVGWTGTNASLGSAGASPDGSNTALPIIESASTTSHNAARSTATDGTSTYTFSFYAKPNGRSRVEAYLWSSSQFGIGFDLNTGQTFAPTVAPAAAVASSGCGPVFAGGWRRCWFTATPLVNSEARFYLNNGTTSLSYTGDGASGAYVWGTDLEALAFPTSYIPTTSASATRAADNISLTTSTPAAGSIFASFQANALTGAAQRVVGGPSLVGLPGLNSAGVIQAYNGSVAATAGPAALAGQTRNAALSWDGTTMLLAADGATSGSVAGTVPTQSYLALGSLSSAGNNWLNGYIRSLALYPTAFNASQLQALSAGTDLTSLSLDFARGLYKTTTPYVRTNLLLQSQAFDSTNWTKVSASVSADQTTAPDGTPTADLITPSSSTSGLVKQTLTVNGSTTYAFSIYLKQGTSTQSRLLFRDETNSLNVLQATAITWAGGVPTIGGVTAGTWIGPVSAGNGWWRIGGFAPTGAGGVSASVQVFPDSLNGTGTVYAWGGQVE